jgi:Protein of unknown function (DUF3052)
MGEEKKSMAEKDYGHRDVVDKLSIKPGHVVVFAREAGKIDAALRQRILERAGRAPAAEDEAVDVVLASVDDTTDVIEVLQRWRTRLKPAGGIWLLTTRRGQPGYMDQRELIAAGIQAGVVDNKVCSISPMISAMRFVIRKKDR